MRRALSSVIVHKENAVRVSKCWRWLAGIGIAPLLLLVSVALFAENNDAVPADFTISLQSAPLNSVNPLETESIVVKADGTAQLSARQGNDGPLQAMQISLSAQDVKAIFDATQRLDFFTLAPEYVDPDIIDGDYAAIEVTANGKTHKVRTQNIHVVDFDILAMTVNARVPFERQVLYNALRDNDVKKVKR